MQDHLTEEWRTIPIVQGYSASTLGRVRNDSTGYILKPSNQRADGSSYQVVALAFLYGSAGRKQYLVHQLVALTFLGPAPENLERPQVNHRDGNKWHNCLLNLEWVSHAGNAKHAWETGLSKIPSPIRGEASPNALLTEDDVRNIRQMLSSLSASAIARQYIVSKSTIQAIKWGRTWKHVI